MRKDSLGYGLVVEMGHHHDDELGSNHSRHRAMEIKLLSEFESVSFIAFIEKRRHPECL